MTSQAAADRAVYSSTSFRECPGLPMRTKVRMRAGQRPRSPALRQGANEGFVGPGAGQQTDDRRAGPKRGGKTSFHRPPNLRRHRLRRTGKANARGGATEVNFVDAKELPQIRASGRFRRRTRAQEVSEIFETRAAWPRETPLAAPTEEEPHAIPIAMPPVE